MEVRATLLEIFAEIGRPLDADWPDERPLELESLEVVLVHEQVEERFGVRVPAREVTPEAFATLGNIGALARRLLDSAS